MPTGVASCVQSWSEAVLGFFYPNICQICRAERSTSRQGYVCQRCRSGRDGVRFIRAPFCSRCGLPFPGDITTEFECSNCRGAVPPFRYARAAVAARGLVLEVIHRYKYCGAVWFEPFLAELLIHRAGPELRSSEWDLIVPVPLHPVKKRQREFNQAERLARRLSEATGIPLEPRALKRVLATRTQTLLSRAERAANVEGAFRAGPEAGLEGSRVVLVDDVLTTGATTGACAKALRESGSEDVCVWTVARGL